MSFNSYTFPFILKVKVQDLDDLYAVLSYLPHQDRLQP